MCRRLPLASVSRSLFGLTGNLGLSTIYLLLPHEGHPLRSSRYIRREPGTVWARTMNLTMSWQRNRKPRLTVFAQLFYFLFPSPLIITSPLCNASFIAKVSLDWGALGWVLFTTPQGRGGRVCTSMR